MGICEGEFTYAPAGIRTTNVRIQQSYFSPYPDSLAPWK